MTRRVLFICARNELRSPTAERVFESWPGVEVASAGLDSRVANPITPELLEWADVIFVMEQIHRVKLSRQHRQHLKAKRIICLDIPDRYDFMDPMLVEILKIRVPRHLKG
jgi:predicted protein tyrosine phosphatase